MKRASSRLLAPSLCAWLLFAACTEGTDVHGAVSVEGRDGGVVGESGDGGYYYVEDDAGVRHRVSGSPCPFDRGALVEDTLGFTSADRAKLPIDHVIVVMKENHSYDQYFGQLYRQGQPGSEPMPSDFSNLDTDGNEVPAFHATTTCPSFDPDHQWMAMHDQVNGGRMDGFVTSGAKYGDNDGHHVMGYFDQSDLPFYYFLANTFAIADRHFASVRSGTWPNRDFMLLGTADGVRRTGERCPDPALPTLFDLMDAHDVSWGVYSNGEPFEGALCWDDNHPGFHKVTAFYDALSRGVLPQVVFVDGRENIEDEHPLADVQVGEAWTRRIYQAVIASPGWPSTAMVFTYDEAGGYFDHVPPGLSCVGKPADVDFFELGIRVPLIMISPWARPHHVSHVQHEHTSITRLIELVFDLPALTGRDASSDALLDMLDFEAPPMLTVPAAPSPGTGGCPH